MGVNLDKPHLWKADTARSVDLYNEWFLRFAPQAFRTERSRSAHTVELALRHTGNLGDISPELLFANPAVLPMLRMATCPPIARDRLIGLAGVSKNLVLVMEKDLAIPPRMPRAAVMDDLAKMGQTIAKLIDPDIFVWLDRAEPATPEEVGRAASIVADRLCGAQADPIIRNAQEARQLAGIQAWLQARGYVQVEPGVRYDAMRPGTFGFRMNVPGRGEDGLQVNIPVDAVVRPLAARPGDLPLLIEAKSAGDFTNVNKRRKEEATKVAQLRRANPTGVRYVLFLCGYFDSPYLGYEAAEGLDWVWEHRMADLAEFGL